MPLLSAGHASIRIVGEFAGDAVVNTLYYGFADLLPASESFIADELATAVQDNIEGDFRNIMVEAYVLRRYEVMIWDAFWAPALVTPRLYNRNVAGSIATYDANGAGPAINFNFVLGADQIVPTGHKTLKRSYIAVGPTPDGYINDDGTISAVSPIPAHLGAFAADIGVGISGSVITFAPQRWGVVLPGGPERTVAPIGTCSYSPRVTFRRSRMNRR